MEHHYYCNYYSCGIINLLLFHKIEMTKQINKKILFGILILISFVLFSALVIEYNLGYKPCKLCVYERIPYFLSILLILKVLLIKGYEKIILLILSLIFFISFLIAFYHFGIERGFFSESLVCKTKDLSETLSKEQLLEELKKNSISCKDVAIKIFGLSLATINAILSVILSVIFIKLFINYGKN